MTIAEMHVNFRQYAQQMGMQNVRAILPEQIDILINQSITDTANQLIKENIGITNDRVITDNSKIGQINAFRTLYDVKEVLIDFGSDGNFEFNKRNILMGLIKHTHKDKSETDTSDSLFGNYMFIVDMSIKYEANADSESEVVSTVDTNWYPIRIIDSAYLADTLNDFVLKPRFRSPVACIYQNDTLELYIDKFKDEDYVSGDSPEIEIQSGSNTIILTPAVIRIDLIKYPDKVKYIDDIGGTSTDCNLPESMHGDIVKHAVDLYRIAVNGSLHSSQEAEQNQQRENVRNNYRNEGNQ